MHKNKKHKQEGGLLVGPSHENGGIGAVVSGGEEVELEGGEYIINAQTVDALGTQFLDKINSTETTYHTGGFGPNELPNPSKYANGGQIRRNNMRRRRKFAHGGYHGDNPYLTEQRGNPYRKGGRVRRKFGHGGMMRNGRPSHGDMCPAGMHMMPDGTCMLDSEMPSMGGSYRRGGRPRKFHEGGYFHEGLGHWVATGPHDHPHSLPGNQFHDFQATQELPGTVPGRPRLLKKPGISPRPPGMPPPRIPDIYRAGGRPRRRFEHGGYHSNSNGMRNGCGPGEMCHGGMMQYEHGGGVYVGSPNSCTDGMGNNVPC